ncbi:Heterokaryon incompatibility protein [Paramyrothecium foliicola]|nr:Heterokaryon incompatibility protein [Paramyrothecium foliicola]
MPYPGSMIRILYIEPGSGTSMIHATLKSLSLSERPRYDALTYTWGDMAGAKRIYVNENKIAITGNLHQALVNMRHPRDTIALWVDQICIDQQNLAEKSNQIPLMTTIYNRARTVRMWLGNHLAPRWVENADELDWSADWAINHANAYPASAKYWLYRLLIEDYWKRTWIIQEVGMATNVQVHFGTRQSMPWTVLVRLMLWYRSQDTTADVRNILRLDSLRNAMYDERTSFELSHLLTAFHDSFATVPHDKVYAFLGMANECRNGCIEVNYNKTLYEVYEDIIAMIKESSDHQIQARVRMLHDASVIRQSLAQRSTRALKRLKYHGKAADPHSYYYQSCGDERQVLCSTLMDPSGNISRKAVSSDSAYDYFHRLLSLIWSKPKDYEIVGLPMSTEPIDMWLPVSGEEQSGSHTPILVRGVVTGTVGHIGPPLSSFLEDARIASHWTTEINIYPQERDRRRARGVNERFMSLLSVSPYSLLSHASKFEHPSTRSGHHEPSLFLGLPIMAGLIPHNAAYGDQIIQFWGSNSALVVRNSTTGHLEPIGRALIVKDDDFGWDNLRDDEVFHDSSRQIVELELSLFNLTLLSLDGVQLERN